jgi:transposase
VLAKRFSKCGLSLHPQKTRLMEFGRVALTTAEKRGTHEIRRPLLVIWDGLPAHRSALVREYLESLNGAVQIEQLPAYAPELNPTEYIWGHLKHHELANTCAQTFGALKTHARNRLRSMQRRPTLIRAFWQ